MANQIDTNKETLKVEIVKQDPEEFNVSASNGNTDAPANKLADENNPVFKQEPPKDPSDNMKVNKDFQGDKMEKSPDETSDADHTLKQNPNPRANSNVPAEDKNKPASTQGAGTEITDGEAG